MTIPLLVLCYNADMLQYKYAMRYLDPDVQDKLAKEDPEALEISSRLYQPWFKASIKLYPVTDEPLTVYHLIYTLLSCLCVYVSKGRVSRLFRKNPVILPGVKYSNGLEIPSLGSTYDVKQVTRYLGKRDTATTMYTDKIYPSFDDTLLIPSVEGIQRQDRKQRDRILNTYLQRSYERPFLERVMWKCFPQARKRLLRHVKSIVSLIEYYDIGCEVYKATGEVDGEILVAFMCEAKKYRTVLTSGMYEMLLACKYVPTSEGRRYIQSLILSAYCTEELSDTEFRPLSRYIQFLGMDRICELELYDTVRTRFPKSFYLIVNKPEQLLSFCPDHQELATQHPLWEPSLCYRAFQYLLVKYSSWYPYFGEPLLSDTLYTKRSNSKETKEIYNKADFLIRHMPKPTRLGRDVVGCSLLLICLVKWPTLSAPEEIVYDCIRWPLCPTIRYGPKSPVLYAKVLLDMGKAHPEELIQTVEGVYVSSMNIERIVEFLEYVRYRITMKKD